MSMRRTNAPDDATVVVENNVLGIAKGYNDPFLKTKGDVLQPLLSTSSVPDHRGRRTTLMAPTAHTHANLASVPELVGKRGGKKSTSLASVPQKIGKRGGKKTTSIGIYLNPQEVTADKIKNRMNDMNKKRKYAKKIPQNFVLLEALGNKISAGLNTKLDSLVVLVYTFKHKGEARSHFLTLRNNVFKQITPEIKTAMGFGKKGTDQNHTEENAKDFVTKHKGLVDAYQTASEFIKEEQDQWNAWHGEKENWTTINGFLKEKYGESNTGLLPDPAAYTGKDNRYHRPSWWIYDATAKSFRHKSLEELTSKKGR